MRTPCSSLVVAAAFFGAACASAADSLCPDAVRVTQTGDGASLVYDGFLNAKDSSQATWRFPRDPRGYWIKCSYRGTTLELSKALPPTVSSCRVTYERAATSASGLPAVKRLACQ